MNERRDPEPPPGTHARIAAATASLSPVQQAWARYVSHATTCDTCRDIDAGSCDTADRLWQAWQAAGVEAFRRLADETS